MLCSLLVEQSITNTTKNIELVGRCNIEFIKLTSYEYRQIALFYCKGDASSTRLFVIFTKLLQIKYFGLLFK